ncbi:MAG TPA: CBS domain-containing protein [Chloroflexota bacterium]|nr:CBS domain-containing protein [Chloroflexota bacterium]
MKSPLVDRRGENFGRVEDVIVRLGSDGYPPVTGLQGRIGDRRVFIPISQVTELRAGSVRVAADSLNLLRFERREGEVLLRTDILRHRLINVEAGRIIRADDIELGVVEGTWRVLGVDIETRSIFQRALHRSSSSSKVTLDWSRIEPFVGHVPSSKLRLPLRRLERLHPAQIADLVEAASHEEGEEIITAVHGDRELEADVFEELDVEHQVEFLEDRSDVEAAAILDSMDPDDAADLIADLPQDRRTSILGRLSPEQLAKVRSLLAYNPDTAGGLMNPEFVALPSDSPIEEAIKAVGDHHPALTTVYVIDSEGRLQGSLPPARLLQASVHGSMSTKLAEQVEPVPARAEAADDFTDVALMMADYNLTSLPVVDGDDRLIGVISVDDVLETMIPEDWRRRAENSGD